MHHQQTERHKSACLGVGLGTRQVLFELMEMLNADVVAAHVW